VSIYLPTDPASNGDRERIEFKTLAAQASSQLREAGTGVRVIRQFERDRYLHESPIVHRFAAFSAQEGQKVRMRQYARQVDRALRPFLNGLEVPLILAATEPIDSIYRSVNTYPHLLAQGVSGNPETVSDAELAARSRTLLDDLYAAQLRDVQELYGQRSADGRALSDVAEVARAATFGAVETLLVDIDAAVPGEVDDQTGAVTFALAATGDVHDVTDEIARRAWLRGARVLAVRARDIPGRGAVAAILRYTL
jgi:Bacterial archaeo-eukaryotic release factor family 11